MKTNVTLLTAALSLGLFGATNLQAQSTKAANVYPSNLEENMYFERYDAATGQVRGLYFLVLSDGNNSRDVTPAFNVTLYLMPEGQASLEALVVAKVYELDGIYHMGSHEFKNETVDLSGLDIPAGRYRLGIWVNSNEAFSQETSDDAMLFQGVIVFDPAKIKGAPPKRETPAKQEKPAEDDGWGSGW